MRNPLFSILVAQYNNGKYFEDCYKSIISQTYQNWEVIIVDDCSIDDSVAHMKQIIGDDRRFKIEINSVNEGCGFTKRKLAELAEGEFCAFLDPDDAITEDAVLLMVTEHIKKPEYSLIYSKPFTCDEFLNIKDERKSIQISNTNPYFFNLDGYVFAFISFKKNFYNKTLGINAYLKRAVDQDLVFILYEIAPFHFLNKTLYKYRIHENGISTTTNSDKAYFWHWVAIIDAAKRRNINIENLFIDKALRSRREQALQKEIDSYNKSLFFKLLRKLGLFKI